MNNLDIYNHFRQNLPEVVGSIERYDGAEYWDTLAFKYMFRRGDGILCNLDTQPEEVKRTIYELINERGDFFDSSDEVASLYLTLAGLGII